MIEFFRFSWVARSLITFILGICVLTQTLGIIFNFYRRRETTFRVFENLHEVSILCEIMVFSILYGQFINSYKNGFLVPSGYENIRIGIFALVSILALIVSGFNRTFMPFIIIPATAISLPFLEKLMGAAYPWLYIGALVFFLGRSIWISIFSVNRIKTSISALSVIHAVDTLHTGVLFSEDNGYTLLSNYQMQNFMLATTGKVFRNSIEFYNFLLSGKCESRYEKAELDGQTVYLLPDRSAWMITKSSISLGLKSYIHISVADVSEVWALTSELQLQNQELSYKSKELKKTIANLHILSEEKEIENAKMRAHDILGQRLTVLLSTIQNANNLDHDLLTKLSKGLLEEIKADQVEADPYHEVKNIQQIFTAIGVDIKFEGLLPDNSQQAGLCVDIIREGSTNAVRHGFATQINIQGESKENTFKLTINNNGYTRTSPITPGSGIRVMKKRVGAQGGTFDILYEPLFTIYVVLPGCGKYE